jgi:hypothetical protein
MLVDLRGLAPILRPKSGNYTAGQLLADGADLGGQIGQLRRVPLESGDEPVLAAKRAQFAMVREIKPVLPASSDAPVLEDVAAGPASFVGDYKPFSPGVAVPDGLVAARTGIPAHPGGSPDGLASAASWLRRQPCAGGGAQAMEVACLTRWQDLSFGIFPEQGRGQRCSCRRRAEN